MSANTSYSRSIGIPWHILSLSLGVKMYDSNGKPFTRSITREFIGWGVNVCFGGANGLVTDIRRYTYRTRQQARQADISDNIGRNGRIA